ncbi:unnamed protein product [Rotaria sordida]|uniref:HAT C-terminal dimerisation domain-containing protein n=1 Tax=Rotaria sordida TaxID=392033 RepID=A0A815J4R0_9BILA|nr:unnamed protein product [Rotaria sordida]CAF1377549.1 unnamed protein product [Rotaria sordida]CAF3931767.1 unnamed protein product [Rotaria sordida]CAF3959864.1 unnamed protein product [Rotaria sordida]
MSGFDSDSENKPLSTMKELNASPSSSSTSQKEHYQTQEIGKLLRMSVKSKQYIVKKNPSQLIKSDAWSKFGFPEKQRTENVYDIISGFVSCSDCFRTLVYDGSTKYMIKHKCVVAAAAATEPVVHTGTMDNYLLKKPVIQKQDKEKMKENFFIWTCSSIRPFSIIEDPGFIDILNEAIRIGQKYSGPIDVEELVVSATTVGNNVAVMAEKYRNLLKPILKKQADDGCLCIAPNLWTDEHRKISYIGITCTFVTDKFNLETIDLCCSEYDEHDKSGTSIKTTKGKVLETTVAATTTTVSKKRRIKELDSSDEENSSDDDELYKKPSPSKQIEATTSLSSLPVKPREVLDIILASKSIVKYVKLTNINYEITLNPGVALQQSTITRWISLSSLLNTIEALLEHIRSILSTRTTAEKQKLNINRINVEGLRDLVMLLKTFEDIIRLIQHGDRPTLHMVYVGLNKLKSHLSGEDVDCNGERILMDDRHEGTDFFRQRLKQLLMVMFQLDKKHLAGALLHPLYRKLTFVNDYQRKLYGYGTHQQGNNHTSPCGESIKKKHRTIEDQFVDPHDDDQTLMSTGTTTNPTIDELDKYLKMSIDDQYRVSNPLIFWQHHQDKLSYLTKLAQRLYSIPATSSCVERQFSASGLLINERRSSLSPDTIQNVLFVRSIQRTLQNNPNLLSL